MPILKFLVDVVRNPTGKPGDPSSNRVAALLVLINVIAMSWFAVLELSTCVAKGDESAAVWVVTIIISLLVFSCLALGIATWDKITGLAHAIRGSAAPEQEPTKDAQ